MCFLSNCALVLKFIQLRASNGTKVQLARQRLPERESPPSLCCLWPSNCASCEKAGQPHTGNGPWLISGSWQKEVVWPRGNGKRENEVICTMGVADNWGFANPSFCPVPLICLVLNGTLKVQTRRNRMRAIRVTHSGTLQAWEHVMRETA